MVTNKGDRYSGAHRVDSGEEIAARARIVRVISRPVAPKEALIREIRAERKARLEEKSPTPAKRNRVPPHDKADRKLFPKIKQLMTMNGWSATRTCEWLAEKGQITGDGTAESKGRRLQRAYLREMRRS